MLPEEQIRDRLDAVRDRIAEALRRAGRPAAGCRLVLASKTQPASALRAAYRAGAREFGENYVQEGVSKQAELKGLEGVTWHLIGHLQTNKARLALAHFDLIQTLDSARLAKTLTQGRPERPPQVLIEINLGGETSKSGVALEEAEPLLEAVRAQVDVKGLMTIPPATDPPGARAYFARLRILRDHIAAATGLELSELSMGMTDDYTEAIAEGATIVRVGRAVFGERQ
jgi:pyridoxal phosphate enzyme (YggS family)